MICLSKHKLQRRTGVPGGGHGNGLKRAVGLLQSGATSFNGLKNTGGLYSAIWKAVRTAPNIAGMRSASTYLDRPPTSTSGCVLTRKSPVAGNADELCLLG